MMDLQVFGCPEQALTILLENAFLSVCIKIFVTSVTRELVYGISQSLYLVAT